MAAKYIQDRIVGSCLLLANSGRQRMSLITTGLHPEADLSRVTTVIGGKAVADRCT